MLPHTRWFPSRLKAIKHLPKQTRGDTGPLGQGDDLCCPGSESALAAGRKATVRHQLVFREPTEEFWRERGRWGVWGGRTCTLPNDSGSFSNGTSVFSKYVLRLGGLQIESWSKALRLHHCEIIRKSNILLWRLSMQQQTRLNHSWPTVFFLKYAFWHNVSLGSSTVWQLYTVFITVQNSGVIFCRSRYFYRSQVINMMSM